MLQTIKEVSKMKNYKILFPLLLGLTSLVACGGSNPEVPPETKTYTITWVNHDDTVLEVDIDVIENTLPSYDGAVPTKAQTTENLYIFAGWQPEVVVATEDTTYKATFNTIPINNVVPGMIPTLSNDGKTVTYGLYPQTVVKDSAIIESLNTLTALDNGWCLYENSYYTKVVAEVYNNESFTFDNGSNITNGSEYWFKCEPITWNVLSNEGSTYSLISNKLLDSQTYYKDYSIRNIDGNNVAANNYKHSDIRSWLNNEFYQTAFALNNAAIKTVSVDNSSTSADVNINGYLCENTNDKIYLPSYKDVTNANYGFTSDESREAKTTDYARVRGSWYNKKQADYQFNGTYWTRTPSATYSYCAWNVNSSGFMSEYAIDGQSHSVRPCITVII
jgi:hypothetical protein